MRRNPNVPKYNFWPITLTATGVAAALIGMSMLGGNEHGSSKTNINIEPSYSVDPLETVEPTELPPLPEKAQVMSMWVCERVVLDRENGRVIVLPVVRNATSGRPLELLDVDAEGAEFTNPQPVNSLEVKHTNGSADADGRLTTGCAPDPVSVRLVQTAGTTRHVLVGSQSPIEDGQVLEDDPLMATCSRQVHDVFAMDDSQMNAFVTRLQATNC